MHHATEKSVLGDFSGATFDYYGVRSRFFRNGDKFLVKTDGPDGKLATFEVKYTFGLDPLQQYLIQFPDGRLQALSIAWDSRSKEAGGQRWFHLYPNEEIRHWFSDIWGQYASNIAVRSRRTYQIMTPAEDVIWKPAPHQMIQATRLLL